MQLDYEKILKDNGFDAVPEAEETTLAFFHEINNTLFDPDSPFDQEQSSIDDFPDMLDHMLYCSLPLKPGKSVAEGVSYLISKWYSDLAYTNPKYESIQRTSNTLGTDIHIFTISKATACSFLFSITDEAAEKATQDYMDAYSPVDDIDELRRKVAARKENKG